MANPTQYWTTGPANIFAGIGAGGAMLFLGFSEDRVEINMNGYFEPIRADFGGASPVDSQFMGMDANFAVNLVRYDEVNLEIVAQRVKGTNQGIIGPGQIGTIMIQEGFAYRVCVTCPYQSKSIYANMRPAFNFLGAWVDGTATMPITTRAKIPRLTFSALPVWTMTSGVLSAVLANEDTTGLPQIS